MSKTCSVWMQPLARPEDPSPLWRLSAREEASHVGPDTWRSCWHLQIGSVSSPLTTASNIYCKHFISNWVLAVSPMHMFVRLPDRNDNNINKNNSAISLDVCSSSLLELNTDFWDIWVEFKSVGSAHAYKQIKFLTFEKLLQDLISVQEKDFKQDIQSKTSDRMGLVVLFT